MALVLAVNEVADGVPGSMHWALGIGDDIYELATMGGLKTHTIVKGPRGIIASAPGANVNEVLKAPTKKKEEYDAWGSFPDTYRSIKTKSEIEDWIKQWVKDHPNYSAVELMGCNCQVFVSDLCAFITGKGSPLTTQAGGTIQPLKNGLAVLPSAIFVPVIGPMALPMLGAVFGADLLLNVVGLLGTKPSSKVWLKDGKCIHLNSGTLYSRPRRQETPEAEEPQGRWVTADRYMNADGEIEWGGHNPWD